MIGLFLFVYWKDITPTIDGPKVVVNKKPYLQLYAGDTLRLRFRRDRSTRWIVKTQDSGRLLIFRDGRRYASRELRKGKNTIRLHFLKGDYRIVSTVNSIARLYVWKKRKWKSLELLGGGYPITLKKGSRRYTYYLVDSSSPAIVKSKGPARLYIYYRAFVESGKGKVPVEITVKRDGRVIVREEKFLKVSKKYVFFDGKRNIPSSKPLVLKIDIPKGVHRFEITVKGSKGAIKVYRESLKKRPKSRKIRVGLTIGMYRTTNAYRYSQATIDTFYLGLKDYRYVGVNSIYDDVITGRLSVRWSSERIRVGGAVTVKKYIRNAQLDRVIYKGYAGYGPMDLELGYLPRRPVRPTYVAPRLYQLLWFSYTYGRVSYSTPIFRTSLTYGRMDFTSPFDNYDANLFRMDGTFKRFSLFRPFFQLAYVDAINPDPNLRSDWTHYYVGGGFSVRLRGAEANLLLRKRIYTTADIQDSHYGREDLEGKFSLSYKFYLRKGLYLRAGYTYSFRNSTVPQNQIIDVFKDYREHVFFIRFYKGLKIG